MRHFTYDNTVLQRDEIIVYAYHPDLLAASTREVRAFEHVLLQYFPRTENDGISRPYDESSDYVQQWRAAHEHVRGILSQRWSSKKFWWTTGLAGATLAVLVATLIDTIIHRPDPTAASTPVQATKPTPAPVRTPAAPAVVKPASPKEKPAPSTK